MPISITHVAESTTIVIVVVIAAVLLSFRKTQHSDLFPIPVTQELKGFGILTVVFSHIGYMLVKQPHFLYPLSIAAGVGVDLFLFMSGYGLTVGMLKKPLPALPFYKRRLIKVFIPFWLALIVIFLADAGLLDIYYPLSYMLQSVLGWFPTAHGYKDVNSPFWYITWMLMYYALFPLLFNAERPWLTAIIIGLIANLIASLNPFDLQANWLHRLHTNTFSLGMLFAWLLSSQHDLVEKFKSLRNESGIERYVVISLMLLFAGYMVTHSSPKDWPVLTELLTPLNVNDRFIDQICSLITMLALIIAFSLKKLDNKFLYIFGIYSYETYLVHWPLMSRYDVFFHYLPAWLAVFVWLLAFLVIGWLLQKITTPLGTWLDSKW